LFGLIDLYLNLKNLNIRNFADGSTLLQKTHHRAIFSPILANLSLSWRRDHVTRSAWTGRGVVLVRDPARAILSYWNYYWTRGNHTAIADARARRSQIFRDFVRTGMIFLNLNMILKTAIIPNLNSPSFFSI
jgi:hypothetical protein